MDGLEEHLDRSNSNSCRLCCNVFCAKLKAFISFTISHLGLIALMCGYCVLGGLIFEKLERDNEIMVKKSIQDKREKLMDDIWSMTERSLVLQEQEWIGGVEERLYGFELELVHAMKRDGWNGFESEDNVLWTFPGSLFFSIVSLTTIGYGDQTPKTTLGKIITVVYVILGMPLLLLCLGNTGKAMAKSFRSFSNAYLLIRSFHCFGRTLSQFSSHAHRFIYWRLCCYVCVSSQAQQRMVSSSRQRAVPLARGRRSLSYHHPHSRGPPLRSMSVRSQASSTFGGPSHMSPESKRRSFRSTRGTWYSGSLSNTSPDGMCPTHPQITASSNETENVFTFNKNKELSQSRSDTLMARPEFHRDNGLRSSNRSRRSTKSLQLNLPSEKVSSGDSSPSSPTTPGIRLPTLLMHQPRSINESFRSQRLTLDEDSMDYPVEVDFYDVEDIWNKEVPVSLCFVVVLAYVMGGSYLFSQSEGWALLDSAYFCIVSLTTIGFGDFVPKTKKIDPELSIAICSTYILFGISLLVMTFNLVQERVIRKVRGMANALGIITDEEFEDMD
ncbi:hypothetical protein TCAL_02008 [Tigriopus californicus]|uniref:Potassium channel domain-containing protein n=1 Tax=Tigriopus californicus TaxID=6832 RepID=A0A553PNP2_TIGCA|nr:hypothetical protein TCAL_02008 [Tigriopus californicus]